MVNIILIKCFLKNPTIPEALPTSSLFTPSIAESSIKSNFAIFFRTLIDFFHVMHHAWNRWIGEGTKLLVLHELEYFPDSSQCIILIKNNVYKFHVLLIFPNLGIIQYLLISIFSIYFSLDSLLQVWRHLNLIVIAGA